MTSGQLKSAFNAQVLEEAARWFVELEGDDADVATHRSFDEWLRRSPEHVRAFLELVPVWEQSGALALRVGPDARALIEQFHRSETNVVPLREPLRRVAGNAKGVTRGFPPRRMFVAVAATLLVAAVLTFLSWQRGAYSTGIGEQRTVVLDDGSTLEMNARSKVRVAFTATERSVELIEGQALFSVAKDKHRAFVVHSGATTVRAVGTQFDVKRKRSSIVVTVIEGRVAVSTGSPTIATPPTRKPSGSGATEVKAGQQLSITRSEVSPPTPADAVATTAWTQQRLSFRKTTLAEVVDEFNRFNRRQMRIEAASLEAYLVSGTFSSTDPSSLLRFLSEQPGIRIIETESSVRILKP